MKYTKKITSILIISLILAVFATPIFGAESLAANEQEFSDMPNKNYWSYVPLSQAIDNGLLQGYNNAIRPRSNLTRGEMAAIMSRGFGSTVKGDISGFTDVHVGDWYYDYIAQAVQSQFFQGYEDSTIRPQNNITREEVCVTIARLLSLSTSNIQVLDTFSDSNSISFWSKEAMAALREKGYINGYDDGTIKPKGYITREEFAQMMYNIISLYVSEPGEALQLPSGNILVRSTGAIFNRGRIKGDLILSEGLGNSGSISIKDTIIEGRLIIRSGGLNGVSLWDTDVNQVVVAKSDSGTVGINSIYSYDINVVNIVRALDGVQLKGDFTKVNMRNATDKTKLILTENAAVDTVTIAGNSGTAEIIMNQGSRVRIFDIWDSSKVSIVVESPSTTYLYIKLPPEGDGNITVTDKRGNPITYNAA